MASSTPRISGLNILEKSANMNNKSAVNSSQQQTIVSKIAEKYGYITQYLPSINISSEGSRIFMAILIPIFIFLLFLLYRNLYSTVSKSVLDNIEYEQKLVEPVKLPSCYEIPANKKYRLADYYICASYMTPCVRNLHYDYVSDDMIKRVLESGARYIQIPICQENVSYESEPVIATAEFGSRVITSLNTLSPIDTFANIARSAFLVKKKRVNFPLIIELVLHTDNKYTLDILGDIIKRQCGEFLVNNPAKYAEKPLPLEELCRLNGKILVISTTGYKNTKLEEIIIPTMTSSFQKMHYVDLVNVNLSKDDFYKSKYNKLISEKSALIDNKNADKKYAEFLAEELKKIDMGDDSGNSGDNSDSNDNKKPSALIKIGDTINEDKSIADKLGTFNKVGITVLEPNYSEDTTPTNYDFTYGLTTGCQILLMNFQVSDENMNSYISLFSEGGFKLKPDGLRINQVITDNEYSMPVGIKDDKQLPVLNDFVARYKNTVITIETNVKPNLYLSYDNNLQLLKYMTFTGAAGTKRNGINQCFTIRKSPLDGDDISVIISPVIDDKKAITYDRNNGFNLANVSDTVKGNKQQAFYPVSPKTPGDSNNVSLLLVDNATPVYIGYKEGGGIVALDNNFDASNYDAMTLKIKPIKYEMSLQIVSLFDGGYGVKSFENGTVGLVKGGLADATKYLVNFVSGGGGDLYADEVYLINTSKKNGKQTYLQSAPQYLQDKAVRPDKTCKFRLVKNKGFVSIVDYNDNYLVGSKDNLLQFQSESDITNSGNENRYLFKIAKSYIVI